MLLALLLAPWIGLILFLALAVRLPEPLPALDAGHAAPPVEEHPWPRVSVIVPARNEAENIAECVGSVAASRYPDFEVIVVDDESDDGTAEIAEEVARGVAASVRVVSGAPVPPGWLGKPWACRQGAVLATGDVLLFTDADTVHGHDLMMRSVVCLEGESADALAVAGRQVLETFWERVVQPQLFVAMLMRFHGAVKAMRRGRWRSAIANGQYFMFTKRAYDAVGGHEAVHDEVAEDLALAQRLVRMGRRLELRMAEDALATRMYRSLPHLVEGWSKNVVMGGMQTLPRWARPFMPPVTFAVLVLLWVVPPVFLLTPGAPPPLGTWSRLTVAISALFWAGVSRRSGISPWYGLAYPLGAAMTAYIFLRAWIRGRRVEWKGREYLLRPARERP
ncbi:MAG: glycosyltransferase [Gemmatimonadota bacterium]